MQQIHPLLFKCIQFLTGKLVDGMMKSSATATDAADDTANDGKHEKTIVKVVEPARSLSIKNQSRNADP